MKRPAAPGAPALGPRALLGRLGASLTSAIGPASQGDREGLHQLRVATRRARALAGHLDQDLPSHERETLRRALRWLAKVTGAARDDDVVSDLLDEIARDLPPPDRRALAGALRALEAQRRASHERLRVALSGEATAALIGLFDALTASELSPPRSRGSAATAAALAAGPRVGARVGSAARGLDPAIGVTRQSEHSLPGGLAADLPAVDPTAPMEVAAEEPETRSRPPIPGPELSKIAHERCARTLLRLISGLDGLPVADAALTERARLGALHALRLAAKKARYRLEWLLEAPRQPGTRRIKGRKLHRRLVALQKVLGALQDVVVARRWIEALTASTPPRGQAALRRVVHVLNQRAVAAEAEARALAPKVRRRALRWLTLGAAPSQDG